MNFTQALHAMEGHQAVIRDSWKNEDGSYDKYLVLMRGMTSVWQILIKPTVNAGNYLFTKEDFQAEDWSIID